jgi:hypothetical protein
VKAGRDRLTAALDLSARLVAAGIGAGDHLVDHIDRTKLLRQGLGHHRNQGEAPLRQQAVELLLRGSVAGEPLLMEQELR